MYKGMLTVLLLAFLFSSCASQTILLKMGDQNMTYEDPDNTIITPRDGINTQAKEIYLMAGFPEKSPTQKEVTFSITGSTDCRIIYYSKSRGQSLTGKIYHYLERIKIQFLADHVNASIEIEVAGERKLSFPLQHGIPAEIAEIEEKNQEVTIEPPVEEKKKLIEEKVKTDPIKVDESNSSSTFNFWKLGFFLLLIPGIIYFGRNFWLRKKRLEERRQSRKQRIEELQHNLLDDILEDGSTEHYAFPVREKIAGIKNRYEQIGIVENVVSPAVYSALETKYKKADSENEQLKNQLSEKSNALKEAQRLLQKVDYPSYYLNFNDGLAEIFKHVEKAKENLKAGSHFNEVFNKMLNFDGKQTQHPLLRFAGRDSFVLQSLKLESKDQLNELDRDAFFNKFVLWHCGNLVNNLSKLFAYTRSSNDKLDLRSTMQEDGVNIEYIKSAFHELTELFEKNFGVAIQVPQIGSNISDPNTLEKVDYCFIKSKYFEKLLPLDPGIIYDINKATIIKKDNLNIMQKGQVCVKV